jgi:hypothetical protein
VAFELVAKLAAGSLRETLSELPGQATQTLTERLEIETKRASITPQNAALLTLTCLSEGCPHPLFKPGWITRLGKTQRYDGSWAGEPLFGTPTRGEVAAWYTSRSVTTAYCYHALKTYQGASS